MGRNNAEPEFLVELQSARDQIDLQTLGSFLSKEEYDAINLVNCSRQFPALITSKGALRSKNNALAASQTSRSGGVFTSDATATPDQREDLLNCSNLCRAKAASWNRQAQLYDDAAEKLKADEKAEVDTEELEIEAKGMTYLGGEVKLTGEETNAYAEANEAHMIATTEKLRCDMSKLAAYVHHADLRLRDLIQLKVAADLKLLRDIKRFGQFELRTWQIGALPAEKHICQCQRCMMPEPQGLGSGVPYVFPDYEEGKREDALPEITLEEDDTAPTRKRPRQTPSKLRKQASNTDANDDDASGGIDDGDNDTDGN